MTQLVQQQQTKTLTNDQVDLIKKTICKDSTDDELRLFVATANRLGLDAFARQIFAVRYGNVMSIQVSIDGFRLVAERTGNYAPGRPTEFTYDDDGHLVSATAYVKKFAGGQWHEVGETAYLVEYAKAQNPLWKTMPRVMLAKSGEARALRRAFPADLSGVYSPEEMPEPAIEPVAVLATPPVSEAKTLLKEVLDATSNEALLELTPRLRKLSTAQQKEIGPHFKAKQAELTAKAEAHA